MPGLRLPRSDLPATAALERSETGSGRMKCRKPIRMKEREMRLSVMFLSAAVLVTACAQTGSAPSNCAGWRPIVLDAASIDGLTDRDAESILAHNLFGREVGCW